jgi:SET domain-containing protein
MLINHSREPNVGFAGNTVLVAMRDISPGEELTTDYALFIVASTAATLDPRSAWNSLESLRPPEVGP